MNLYIEQNGDFGLHFQMANCRATRLICWTHKTGRPDGKVHCFLVLAILTFIPGLHIRKPVLQL